MATTNFDGRPIFLSYAVLVMMYPLIELHCNARTKAITLILSDPIKDYKRLEEVLKNIGVQDFQIELLLQFLNEVHVCAYLGNFAYLDDDIYWEYIFKCPDLRYNVCHSKDFQRASELGCILGQVFSDISLLDKLVEQGGLSSKTDSPQPPKASSANA